MRSRQSYCGVNENDPSWQYLAIDCRDADNAISIGPVTLPSQHFCAAKYSSITSLDIDLRRVAHSFGISKDAVNGVSGILGLGFNDAITCRISQLILVLENYI